MPPGGRHTVAPLDPAAITRRWSRVLRSDGCSVSGVTTAGTSVFTSTGQSQSTFDRRVLPALSQVDGQTPWQQDFGTDPIINPPAAADGNVHLALTGSTVTPLLLAFDAATGVERARRDIGAQFDRYLAPTLRDGFVCTPSGSFGGMGCHDAVDLSIKWQTDLDSTAMTFTPAVDANTVYAFVEDRLRLFNRYGGVQFRTVPDPQAPAGAPREGLNAPVLAGGGKVLVSNHGPADDVVRGARLARIDATTGTIDWQVVDRISSNPVPAGRLVLVVHRAAPPPACCSGRGRSRRSPATAPALRWRRSWSARTPWSRPAAAPVRWTCARAPRCGATRLPASWRYRRSACSASPTRRARWRRSTCAERAAGRGARAACARATRARSCSRRARCRIGSDRPPGQRQRRLGRPAAGGRVPVAGSRWPRTAAS